MIPTQVMLKGDKDISLLWKNFVRRRFSVKRELLLATSVALEPKLSV